MAENTYLLTLDGDIDFQPPAVSLLVDLMKKNKNLGAACGRIHPVGSGPMVWYQLFEYAIGKMIKLYSIFPVFSTSQKTQIWISFWHIKMFFRYLQCFSFIFTGHWLQKATEHMIGCVMCSPGCFSLFRAKALMDDNVMRRYTTKSEDPMHFVQYDQVRFFFNTVHSCFSDNFSLL